MTFELKSLNSFHRDYKLCQKRGKKISKLETIIEILRKGAALPAKHREHKLSGKYENMWECHIEPDWLLVYRYEENFLILERLGTHSDLFK